MKDVRIGLLMTIVVSAFLLPAGTIGCGSTEDGDDGNDGEADAGNKPDGSDNSGTDELCPVVVPDEGCDDTERPFVFVHGTYGSGNQIANVAMLFGSNGYCQDRFYTIEYNSVPPGEDPTSRLDALIDQVLKETGADKVELGGHSQGTIHCAAYMNVPQRAAKIAHYINFSGLTVAPPEIPELALSSENDLRGAPILPSGPNITQFTMTEEDHVAVAGSANAFEATWKFLYDKDPKYKVVQCGEEMITIDGVAESFGDNSPVVNGRLEVYELDYDGPPRERGEPVMVIHGDAEGRTEPVQLKRNTPYEFKGFDGDGNLVGYVYPSPFRRSNRIVRFLVPSKNGLVAMMSTDNIKRSPKHVAMIGLNVVGAFRKDLGHTLKINGVEVLTDENAGKPDSVVGFFMYDDNENGKSDLGAVFGPAAFLVGTDVYVDATEPAWIELQWHDPTTGLDPITMKIPNWPSDEALILLYL